MFQDKINKYIQYFRGLDIKSNIIIIKVQFLEKWVTSEYKDETIKVAASEKIPNEWFFYGNVTETTIDKIFDFVEETIKFNLDLEKKKDLFEKKKKELVNLFSQYDVEQLSDLKFVIGKRKGRKPKKDKILAIEDKMSASEAAKPQPKKTVSKKEKKNEIIPLKQDVIIKGKDIDNIEL